MLRKFWIKRSPDGDGGGGGGGGGGAGADPLFGGGGGPNPPNPPNPAPPAPGEHKPIALPDNWHATLPDDLKQVGNLGNFKTVDDLLRSYGNAQKMVGADKIPVPGKGATAEQWKDVFKRLGLPEKIEDFKIELGKDAQVDPAFVKGITEVAHLHGVLPQQLKPIVEWFDKVNKESHASLQVAAKAKMQEAMEGLQKEWGAKYDDEILKAKAAILEFSTPEEQAAMQKSGLTKNPNFLKLLAKFGATLAEDKIRGAGGGNQPLYTPAQASERANKLMNDPSSGYFDASHPNHQAVKKEVTDLFAMAHPGNNQGRVGVFPKSS